MKGIWKRSMGLLMAMMLVALSLLLTTVETDAAIQDFYMNQTTKTMVVGDSCRFRLNIASGRVTWESSNKKVASVTQGGKVTAKRRGTAVIKATVRRNGKTSVYRCKLTVVAQQSAYVPQTVRLINRARRGYGWPSLNHNSYLQQAAQKRAQEIATKSFSVKRPNGTSFTSAISMKYNFAQAAQSIARKYATPKDVVNGWMSNSAAKANIISRRYTDVGVGVYLADDGYLYWVAIFASKK